MDRTNGNVKMQTEREDDDCDGKETDLNMKKTYKRDPMRSKWQKDI